MQTRQFMFPIVKCYCIVYCQVKIIYKNMKPKIMEICEPWDLSSLYNNRPELTQHTASFLLFTTYFITPHMRMHSPRAGRAASGAALGWWVAYSALPWAAPAPLAAPASATRSTPHCAKTIALFTSSLKEMHTFDKVQINWIRQIQVNW